MQEDKLKESLINSYQHKNDSLTQRISNAIRELNTDIDSLNLDEIRTISTTILDIETKSLKDDMESLLAQKELIERSLEKKYHSLQESKCEIFNAIETELNNDKTLLKLHQIKLQSVALYDFLSEMVESAIITTLEKEKDIDIKETIQEVIKDITFEAIKEGSLNTIRIRKILSTILQSAIDISEATPTKANDILNATLRGMRNGLIHSIDRFKKRLAFMPIEAKHILIEDYDTIMEDLNQTDTLFSQVVQIQAAENTKETQKLLLEIDKDMRYDLQELINISKETADAMRKRFSSFAKDAVKTADNALNSETAIEAKRMGIQAFNVAKVALGSAIKSAKDAMER
ncbi:MAG: hypothetical protein GXO30_01220 [Epsilonproteobacteria bacterium]|nr:hypothetical protein [Campylobacterota bacterium]